MIEIGVLRKGQGLVCRAQFRSNGEQTKRGVMWVQVKEAAWKGSDPTSPCEDADWQWAPSRTWRGDAQVGGGAVQCF